MEEKISELLEYILDPENLRKRGLALVKRVGPKKKVDPAVRDWVREQLGANKENSYMSPAERAEYKARWGRFPEESGETKVPLERKPVVRRPKGLRPIVLKRKWPKEAHGPNPWPASLGWEDLGDKDDED